MLFLCTVVFWYKRVLDCGVGGSRMRTQYFVCYVNSVTIFLRRRRHDRGIALRKHMGRSAREQRNHTTHDGKLRALCVTARLYICIVTFSRLCCGDGNGNNGGRYRVAGEVFCQMRTIIIILHQRQTMTSTRYVGAAPSLSLCLSLSLFVPLVEYISYRLHNKY